MNTLLKAALLSVVAFAVTTGAYASDQPSEKYFAISGYFVDPDDLRGTDREGTGGDVAFGLQLTGPLYVEVRAFGAILETGLSGGSDFYNAGAGVDLQVLLGQRGSFAAFVLGGVAFAYNDVRPNSLDEGVFQANAGIGLLSRGLTPAKIRLRIEGRAMYEDFLGGVNDFRVGMGFEIPVDAAEVIVREVPVDRIVESGPAQGAYPQRPATDSDGDGVLDHFDACPGTLPNTKVDRAGCALAAQAVTLQGVKFELDSARLTPESLNILGAAVKALNGQPPMYVTIAGHTDSTGSVQFNSTLSWERARAVKHYLVSQGIAPARMEIIGHGEDQPIASNETDAGRAANRRVEFQITKVNP